MRIAVGVAGFFLTLSSFGALAQPVLSITKMHSGNFTQGQTGTWTISVSNSGTSDTSSAVTVADTLPIGYTLVSGTGTGWSCSGTNTVSCTYSGVVVTMGNSFPALTLMVSVPADSPVSVQNQATASGGGAASPATSAPDMVTVNQVAATITAMSGTPQSAQTNTAFASPLVVIVKDAANNPVPNAPVTFTVPISGASGTFAGGQNTATTGANGQASSMVFTANGTAGSYSVTAASGAATGATFLLTNTAPTLSITKMHSGNFTQGQNAAWTLTVGNTGTGSTSGTVTVTDTLPSGYTLVSGTGTGWSCSGTSVVSCTSSTVVAASGTFAPLILTVSVPANSPVSVQNSATASGGGAASSATSNTDTVPVGQVAASIAAMSGTPQSAQTNAAFASPLVATVRDAGGALMPNAIVTFTVPNSGASGTFAGGQNTATTNGTGQATSMVFTANGTAGSYSVTAASGAATGATFSLTNTAPLAPTLSISKSHGTFTQGQNGAWTLNVGNTGTGSTSGTVTVTDTLPTGYTLVSGTGTGWSCSGTNAVSCTNSTVVAASGSFAPLLLTVSVPANSPTSVQNFATASGGGAASSATSNTDTVPVAQVPASITITGGNGQSAPVGTAFLNALVVTVKDAANSAVPNVPVTFTAPASGASGKFLNNTNTTTVNTDANGIATATMFTANSTVGPYNVVASATGATSMPFGLTNTAGGATKLTFTTQPPSTGTAGTAFGAVVHVEDSGGNLVTTSTASITITSTAPGVTGTTTVVASGGVATFTNLILNTTGSYTLTAAAASLTSDISNSITIAPGAASQLVFTTPPSNGTAGQALTPAVVVKIQDSHGNVVNSNAPITVSSTPTGVTGTTQVSAVAGVATFNNLSFNTANSYTLTAAGASLTSSPSSSFTIAAASANKLVFTTQPPANGTAGQAFSAVVKVQDANGNLVTTSTASITIGSSPSGITGTVTVPASGGVANFSGLMLNTAGSYTLSASAAGLTNATSNPVAIGAAAASQLVFSTQPSSGTAGQALTPSVVVQIKDAFGNVVNSNAQVTVASTPLGVSGTTQVAAVAGVATFNNLVFNTANNYTLTATAPSITSSPSNSFTISAASANKLVFTTQPPANGTAGQAFSAVVKVQDANGNVAVASITQVTITSPASITGTTQVTAVNGVATFNNLILDTAGSYTLTATSTGLTNASSTQIAIGAAAASQLVFSTQPSSGTAGQALTPAVVTKIQDAFGNLVSSNAAVAVASNPTGVGGTTQVNAIAGVATFNSLQFSIANNYTLTATSGSLASAVSSQFTISAASANKLVFTTQPPANGTAGQAFSAVVKVQDANGNVVTGSSAQVTITSPSSIMGTTQVTAVNGVATFNNLILQTAGSYTLAATSAGLTNASSTQIAIGPAAASQLVFTTQPSSGTAGQALTPAVVVQIQDAFGNVVNSNAAVDVASNPTGVAGTTHVNAIAGVATFNGLQFTIANNYTLTATSGSLASAVSSQFTISAASANKLVFTTQPPANGIAGQSFTAVVKVQDANGNVVTGSSAQITISWTPDTVGFTTGVTAVNGVATFNNLFTNKAGSYTLTATSTGLTNAISTPIAIGPTSASQVVFTTPPNSGTAGQALTPAVVATIQDVFGNPVNSSAQVTITSNPSGVNGTTQTNAVNGAATFNNLTFNVAQNYTLTVASAGLTGMDSSPFTISAGSGNKLVFTSQPPANGTAGQALSSTISVQVQDANGNLVTGSNATVNISSTAAGVSGTLSVPAVSGVATFNSLLFNNVGTYTLTATSTGLSNATSTAVTIGPGAASKLAFTVQPSSSTAGQPLTPAVVVQIQDAFQNLVTGSTAPVTVSSTPSGLGGTLTVNAVGGVATFGNLSITTAGNYTMAATSSGLTNANSASFTISPGSGNRLVFAVQPPSTNTAGQPLSPPVVVRVQDANGNLVTASTAAVSIGSTPSGVTGTLTVNASGGIATFNNLVFTTGGTYTLNASSTGLSNAVSTSVVVTSTLRIVTDSLSNATQSALYSQQLTATGGTPPYVWSMPSGALASGLNLGTSGLITGNPAASGNFGFTARVRDNVGLTADKAYTLVVANSLSITSCPTPNGIVGQTYSSTATATGGQLPYLWSLQTGALPPGLALNPLNGGVSGIPTSSGTFAATFQATDRSGATASQGCGFTIAPPLTINTLSISDASQSSPYTQTLFASGGKGPYVWTLTAGSLPPGLAFSPNGTISGTPTQLGSSTFIATVTDSTGAMVQQSYALNVLAGLIVGACPVNISEVGFSYNSALVAQGGAAPYTWLITSGTLPPGLQLNSTAGTISGTPSQVGQTQITITATDRASRSATPRQCSIDVRPALAIATTTLSQGATGAAYSDAVTVNGGVSPYVFSTTGGSLPPGVALDAATGKITGRPNSAGSFSFTLQVIDNLGAQSSKNLSITIGQGLAIPNCPPPVGNVGQPYSGALVAQGGTSPYRWTIGSGSLPTGLALDSPNSIISGTPSQPGASTFVLQVNDAGLSSVTRACQIQINAAPLTVTSNSSLPNALIGVAYTQTFAATGGRAPYVWSISSGALPDGFSLDPTGVLSGSATAAGTYSFTLQVTDQDNNVARQNVTLTLLAGTAPNVSITGLPDIVDPATQPAFNIQLDGPYPAQIDGTVTLTFVPDPTVGVDDPTIQFATSGRTLKFTIAPNSTTVVFAGPRQFQSGTVAGTIQLSVKLSSSGSDITPPNTAVRSIRVDRLSPRIASMTVVRNSNGLEVDIIGFSTTREVTQGTFQFSISGGAPITVTVPLSDGGKTWFQSTQSLASGGQFKLVQPFTFQGNVGTVTSVSVTLTNGQGTSAAASANF